MIAPDAEQREQALDASESFICEAPAGSGKTELLIQRYLTLLSRVKKPEEILAITFTRKATGEMRERILAALQSARQAKPQQAHKLLTWNLAHAALEKDAQLGWNLLHNPNRLQIKTFDSLCASLARHLPMESSLGALPQVSENAEQLYREAVRALLADLEQQQPWSDALAEILHLLDNRFDKFESMMLQLLSKREQWLPLMAAQGERRQIKNILEQNLQHVLRDNVEAVRRLIPFHLHAELVNLSAFAAANLRAMEKRHIIRACEDLDLESQHLPGHQGSDIPKWLGICAMLTTFGGKWRTQISKTIGFPQGETAQQKQQFEACKQQLKSLIAQLQNINGMEQALANLRMLPYASLDQEQWTILDALFTVLPVLSARLNVVFQQHNCVDFIELNLAAQRALGQLEEPTQLALKLDYQLQHILVDEFQDTSNTQVHLLNLLTAGWQADDGRTLFCVGDAMQSIYGFRGAKVGLFLNCREKGLANVPLTPLRLSANFRSQSGIVDWINKVFGAAFPQMNDISTGAVSYSPSAPVLDKLKGKAAWVHGFEDRQESYDEARIILGIIRKSRSDNPDASIAVLVRNRDHVSHITPLLKDAGLNYRAVDLEPLQDHSVIQDLIALTRALLHPADRTAWLAVLRAPWCGLGLVDLEALANFCYLHRKQFPTLLEQAQQTLQLQSSQGQLQQADFFTTTRVSDEQLKGQALSPDGQQRLQRSIPVLSEAVNNCGRKTLRDWIEGTWLQLGGPACVEDSAALENAEVFFKLLEKWEYASDLDKLEQLEEAIAKLYATPDPSADEKLQIMTIHKSKGLEFDVVIVPSLQRRPRSNDSSLLMWRERLSTEGNNELLMAPLTQFSNNKKHPTYLHLRNEESKAQDYENCRLLYVACTRAKQQLHLSAFVKKDPKGSMRLKRPARSSLLSTIWEPVQTRIKRYPNENEQTQITEQQVKPRALHSLPRDWSLPPLQTPSYLQQYIPHYEYGAEENQVKLDWQNSTARISGTVIHYYLQNITEQGVDNWHSQKLQQSQTAIRSLLCQHGISASDLQQAEKTVFNTLEKCLQSDQTRKLLRNDYPFSACEYALSIGTHKGPSQLVIDRVFTDDTGRTWLIDYKTAEPENNQDLDIFLKEQTAIYINKMRLYEHAMTLKGFSNIVLALYFPATGSLVKL